MKSESLENRIGRLAELVPKFRKNSWRTSAELTTERRTNKELTNQWFWTANFALYRIEDKEAILYFGGRKNNPIFKNIDETAKQLISEQNYTPSQEDAASAIKSSLRIKLSDLNLLKHDDEFSYFEIDTANYESSLNAAQRGFAEAVYGKAKDFKANMKMLSNAGIAKTRIYVLNPEYVKQKTKKNEAIARACWLDYFYNFSYFNAYNRYLNDTYFALRGVLLISAEGGRRKVDDVTTALDKILENPEKTLQTMNNKPEYAKKVLALISKYYNPK